MRNLAKHVPALLFTSAIAGASLFSGATGCGGDDDGGDTGDAPTADAGAGLTGRSWTLDWGPVTVEASSEDTRCVTKRLDNEESVKIGQFKNVLGTASHHMIIYRLTEGEEILEPTPCSPFADVLDPTKGAPLAITQTHEELIKLPDGVAYTFEPNQLIRIEVHYINTTTSDLEVTTSATFIETAPEAVEHEADFLFIGTPDIELPPMADGTAGTTGVDGTDDVSFLPLPPELADINIFAITGHEHKYGTGVTISVTDDAGEGDEVVYAPENFKWDEPETVYPEPVLNMPEGHGFRFTCTYKNTSDTQVAFGDSVNDEMCFFWAYYYPSKGAKVCVHSQQAPEIATSACCPGNSLCALLND